MHEQCQAVPKVYIILINWNGASDTLECLTSIKRLSYPNYEIIVVDNGSSDNSVTSIKERHPEVITIESQNNLGFSGGNNLAINFALKNGADYVWLLNNDTVVDNDALSHLVRTASQSVENGIVGSVIYNYADREIIQFSDAAIDWKKAKFRISTLHHVKTFEAECAHGCSMLVSRQVCLSIGLLDEKYFLYVEELDWCVRARNAAFKCLIEPKSRVYHKLSASVNKTGGKGIVFNYYNTRNFLYLIDKLCPYRQRKLITAKLILKYIRRDKTNFAKMLLSYLFRLNLARPEQAPKLFAAKDYLLKNMGKTRFIKG